MIPNMDLFDGWGGFLGFRDVHFPDSLTVRDLRRRSQRFPDTPTLFYNNFVINQLGSLRPPLLERKSANPKPLNASVAVIGSGIAGLISALELSRCGVKVTVFERAGDPTKGQRPFGGRLATDVRDGYVAELGAAAFPVQSPLVWHYVWRWAVSEGLSEDDADKLVAKRFPSPGTVPTVCCYLNEWFEPSKVLSTLPSAVRTAAFRFRSWLRGLNDGAVDWNAVYLRDAMRQASDPTDRGNSLVRFWEAMIRRYGGRSFGSVLRTEVFGDAPDATALYEAFAAVGVGTGGFGPVEEISALEVLRHVVWDFTSLFMLPDLGRSADTEETEDSREQSAGRGGAHMQAFAAGLANEALVQSQCFYPDRTSEDMFRFGAPVAALCVLEDKTRIGVCLDTKDPIPFDYTIVAISSRAMQALGLGQDHPTKNPFRTWGTHTQTSSMAVHSIQAAVHRLHMTSGYKSFARIPKPETIPAWPTNRAGELIRCFITDRYPRSTTVMPARPGQAHTMLVAAETWAGDALKFQDLRGTTPTARLSRIIQAFQRPDSLPDPWGFQAIADQLVATTDQRERDWNTTLGFNGAARLNRPDDEYFAASLLCHAQLVYEPDSENQPWGRTFLAGDSVGYLGGWAEGAAMSALTAITAVLFQVRKTLTEPADLLSEPLINNGETPFHQWTHLTAATTTKPPDLKTLTAIRRPDNHYEQNPPTWRWNTADIAAEADTVVVSQDGTWLVAGEQGWFGWSKWSASRGRWSNWDGFNHTPRFERVAVSASRSVPNGVPDVAQAVAANPHLGLYHCPSVVRDAKWNLVDLGGHSVGKDCAIAVLDQPDPTSAHVVVLSSDNAILHSIRDPRGNWQQWFYVPSGNESPLRGTALAATTSAGTEYFVLTYIDLDGTVTVIGRHWDMSWTAPMTAPHGNLRAEKITVFGLPTTRGRVQVVAQFNDGNLYHRLFDVPSATSYPWRALPYPATSAFTTTSITIGASTNPCDYQGSATLWITSTPKPQGQEREVEDQ